jgi:hypothetical protein
MLSPAITVLLPLMPTINCPIEAGKRLKNFVSPIILRPNIVPKMPYLCAETASGYSADVEHSAATRDQA